MLKKLLPYLQHLQVLKNRQSPPPQSQNQSPNLVFTDDSSSVTDALKNPPLLLVSFLVKAIIIVQFVFITVFVLNVVFNILIFVLNADVSNLASKILSYQSLVVNTQKVVDKTALYKSISTERLNMSHYLDVVILGAKDAAEISHISATDKRVSIAASAASPINFSVLLNNYFLNKDVSQVILRSANLDTLKGAFEMEIDVQFK